MLDWILKLNKTIHMEGDGKFMYHKCENFKTKSACLKLDSVLHNIVWVGVWNVKIILIVLAQIQSSVISVHVGNGTDVIWIIMLT